MQKQLKKQRLPARDFLNLISPKIIATYTPFTEIKPELTRFGNQNSGVAYKFGGASGLYKYEARYLTDLYTCSSQGEEPFVMLACFFKGDVTVLFDGYGEYNFNQAEFIIVPCPRGMKKMDVVNGQVNQLFILLQITRDLALLN